MTHDGQRQRVYDAEQRVCAQLDFAARGARAVTVGGSTVTVDGDRRFGSLDAAQAWLDRLRTGPWFAARWPAAARAPVAVRPRRGQARAHYEIGGQGGIIAVPVPGNATGWAMREMVLAHELAHHVIAWQPPPGGDGEASAWHGAAFAAAMLALVGRAVGEEARLLLTVAYHDGGVAVGPAPGAGGAGERAIPGTAAGAAP